jgi:DNA-binding NtrC family response regulator
MSSSVLQSIGATPEELPPSLTIENLKSGILKSVAYALLREAEPLDYPNPPGESNLHFYDEVRRFEIHLIERALIQANGKQRRAATLLSLKTSTLHAKIKLYNISVSNFSHAPGSAEDQTSQPVEQAAN